jgi:serine-type D-Ala-D-Ala carboxypeptidase/endopeptidase (penicillin-binding protein 4)
MVRLALGLYMFLIPVISFSQQVQIEKFLSDSSMIHSSASLYIADAETGSMISQYNPQKSLIQASILKLITTVVALEKLGKDYTFKTTIGYTGKIGKSTGTLEGDLVIKGGGDPTLGSENFPEYYNGFMDKWILDIKSLGIKKITGRIITDDSYYDFQPTPGGWNWEDIGNYYGAGAFGLSVFDNTLQIHFRTAGKGSLPVITSIFPKEPGIEYSNFLTTSGNEDNGYIFSAPYSTWGWMAGTIPENKEDFILKGSIPDPPLFLARTLYKKLAGAGIKIIGKPVTTRIIPEEKPGGFTVISETISPPLSAIIKVLNHKSVNLYAEHLIKQLGKVFKNSGTTSAGIEVVKEYLDSVNVKTAGIFIEDGSGLSPRDAISSAEVVKLLLYMRRNGRFFDDFLKSIPEAGREGTLKNSFKDTIFESRLWVKSGSMARVRSYAGYFKTISGKEMIFCIIVNNFEGSPGKVLTGIEEIIKAAIVNN